MQLPSVAIWKSVKGSGSAMPAPQHHIMAPRAPGGSAGKD
jgi:hypothetical protein